MKNFARLVRFAWPYRVRFGLSLACAAMVAVFWGGNIGAVYPLLQILIRSQNCQHWIEEKIQVTDSDALALKARLDELDVLTKLDVPDKVKQARLDKAAQGYGEATRNLIGFRQGLVGV